MRTLNTWSNWEYPTLYLSSLIWSCSYTLQERLPRIMTLPLSLTLIQRHLLLQRILNHFDHLTFNYIPTHTTYCHWLLLLTVIDYHYTYYYYSEPLPVTTTFMGYDKTMIKAQLNQLAIGFAFMCFLHLKFGYIRPLFFQTILGLKNLYSTPLIQVMNPLESLTFIHNLNLHIFSFHLRYNQFTYYTYVSRFTQICAISHNESLYASYFT